MVDERHLPLKVHRQIALKVTREVKLNIGGSVYDPTDPIGKLLFTVLTMIAESEADLARMRTREGMAIAKAKGRLRGKKPDRARSGLAGAAGTNERGRPLQGGDLCPRRCTAAVHRPRPDRSQRHQDWSRRSLRRREDHAHPVAVAVDGY